MSERYGSVGVSSGGESSAAIGDATSRCPSSSGASSAGGGVDILRSKFQKYKAATFQEKSDVNQCLYSTNT